ncbi:nucleoside diphosphate kinase regulator [Pontiella agarivorans]|uniref:Nucleoside diphosphate kinase regulator n=1 Tax=Pontiella agarivorans TaxID=3038953 RepID=A0ABU5MVI0_9BACT|nr:nucleoside diphosphate kinase regulator [Pontiella agarivorans]MDZ8118236.1 nucleoside diphosphate kinase regulator [Pontiella agarivorans]
MKEQPIIMTWPDHARLTKLLEEHRVLNPRSDRKAFEKLEKELARAQLIAAQDIPADIITMDSKVQVFDLDLGDEYSITLSWPHEANVSENRINVLAPLGMALLGSRVGQKIEWPLPESICRLKVIEILFQPENSKACEAC